MTKRLGILTGGGDCPGLNAVIRAVVRRAEFYGITVYGIDDGFKGLAEDRLRKLCQQDVSGLLPRGGTVLRSTRFNPFKEAKLVSRCLKTISKHKLDGLIVVGGEGSLGIGLDLFEKQGVPVLGIPKTIDNDVFGTEYCVGFFTAVQTATEAIDRLHTTAESHNFVMIAELMGRHCGYLAAYAGLAGGADYILVPERDICIDELVNSLKERHKSGKNFSIVAVAEDARLFDVKGKAIMRTPTLQDEYGHIKTAGAGLKVRDLLVKKLGFEVRLTVLGHIQRGGSPVAMDRILATLYGCEAVRLASEGRFGRLIAYDGGRVMDKDLNIIHQGVKRLSADFFEVAATFFG